jgi:hypothetical protein
MTLTVFVKDGKGKHLQFWVDDWWIRLAGD